MCNYSKKFSRYAELGIKNGQHTGRKRITIYEATDDMICSNWLISQSKREDEDLTEDDFLGKKIYEHGSQQK